MSTQSPMDLVKAPALVTDAEPPPPKLDPKVGKEAYAKRAPFLQKIEPSTVSNPNYDATTAALVALQFVRAARVPRRLAQFQALDAQLAPHSIDLLEEQAWCLWYLDSRYQSTAATTGGARIDVALADRATQARARAMRLLGYYFQDNAAMVAELADIHQGSGYVDLATDLTRLAGHLDVHDAKLSGDTVNYRADDVALLRGLANQIVEQLNADRGNETLDLRNRSAAEMNATYAALKSAADFLFRNSPADLALFPTLRTAVIAITSKYKASPTAPAEPAPVDALPASPPASPTVPALPGGSPFVR